MKSILDRRALAVQQFERAKAMLTAAAELELRGEGNATVTADALRAVDLARAQLRALDEEGR